MSASDIAIHDLGVEVRQAVREVGEGIDALAKGMRGGILDWFLSACCDPALTTDGRVVSRGYIVEGNFELVMASDRAFVATEGMRLRLDEAGRSAVFVTPESGRLVALPVDRIEEIHSIGELPHEERIWD